MSTIQNPTSSPQAQVSSMWQSVVDTVERHPTASKAAVIGTVALAIGGPLYYFWPAISSAVSNALAYETCKTAPVDKIVKKIVETDVPGRVYGKTTVTETVTETIKEMLTTCESTRLGSAVAAIHSAIATIKEHGKLIAGVTGVAAVSATLGKYGSDIKAAVWG